MSPLAMKLVTPDTGPDTAALANSAKDPAKIHDAAQQFEALLLGQILRSFRESSEGGWLGSGSGASGCATEFAEQHLAQMMAQQGGLGLSNLITQGLERES